MPMVALTDSLVAPADSIVARAGRPLPVAAAEAALRSASLAVRLERRSLFAATSISTGFETHDPAGDEKGILPVIGFSIPFPLFNRNSAQCRGRSGGTVPGTGGARCRGAGDTRGHRANRARTGDRPREARSRSNTRRERESRRGALAHRLPRRRGSARHGDRSPAQLTRDSCAVHRRPRGCMDRDGDPAGPHAHGWNVPMIDHSRQLLIVTSCALAALAAACSGGGDESESEPSPVVAVRTAVVSEQPFTETLGAIGTVAGRPGHFASLSAPTATRVSKVYVSEGARVSPGQPLVELDRTAIEATAAGRGERPDGGAAGVCARRATESRGRRAAQGCGAGGQRGGEGPRRRRRRAPRGPARGPSLADQRSRHAPNGGAWRFGGCESAARRSRGPVGAGHRVHR